MELKEEIYHSICVDCTDVKRPYGFFHIRIQVLFTTVSDFFLFEKSGLILILCKLQ